MGYTLFLPSHREKGYEGGNVDYVVLCSWRTIRSAHRQLPSDQLVPVLAPLKEGHGAPPIDAANGLPKNFLSDPFSFQFRPVGYLALLGKMVTLR